MVRRFLFLAMLLATLAVLPGCLVHDTGYYPYDRAYYYGPYRTYYYEPYLVAPFWFSGSFIISDSDRRHNFYGHRRHDFGGRQRHDFGGRRGFEGRGGGRR